MCQSGADLQKEEVLCHKMASVIATALQTIKRKGLGIFGNPIGALEWF